MSEPGSADARPSPPPGASAAEKARVDPEGFTDDCSGHPLPAPPVPRAPAPAASRSPLAARGAGRRRQLLLVLLPTAAVLAVAGIVTTRLLLRGTAEAHPAVPAPAPVSAPVPLDDEPPTEAPLTEEAVRKAAALLTLDVIHDGDPPTAVISGQEVDLGSIIHVEVEPPIDFRVAAIEPLLVRLVVDAMDPPLEIELVQER